jgi:hypothetical protein
MASFSMVRHAQADLYAALGIYAGGGNVSGGSCINMAKMRKSDQTLIHAVLAGNVDANPLFVNAAAGGYRLQAGSPCRDRGNNAALPADEADLSGDGNLSETLPRDLALRSRIEGTTVDMGAFEYIP